MQLKRALLVGAAMAAAGLGGAHAQSTVAPSAQDNAPPTDVVVTAQKRKENVQRVPVAVTVLSARTLENAGVDSFTDLTKVAPEFTFQQGDQPGNATLYLRGVGTTGSSVGLEPSVGAIIDDVPAGFRQRVFADLPDVDHVEVLRGPQSTLFGKSASAGLINIVSKAPSATPTGSLSASETSDNEFRANGTLSGPLIRDVLSYRLTGSYGRWDGNVKNLASGGKLDGYEQSNIHGKLVWNPINRLTVTGAFNFDAQQGDCCTPVLVTFPAVLPAGSTVSGQLVAPDPYYLGIVGKTIAAELPGVTPGKNNHAVYADNPPYQKGQDFNQSLKAQYDLGGGYSLLAVLANSHYKLNDGVDADFTADPAVKTVQPGYTKANSRSAELRLTSPDTQPIRFIVGLFSDEIYAERRLGRTATVAPVPGTTATRTAAGNVNYDAFHNNRDYAVFGQIDWDLTSRLTLTGGLRLQRELVTYEFNDYLNNRLYPAGRGFVVPGEEADDATTGKIAARYQLTPDLMGYVSYTTGFKGAAFDLTSGFNDTVAKAGPVRPEKSKSYEAGVRSQWLARRLTVNVTIFDATYDDFQARQFDPNLGITYLTNIPQVETTGLELDSQYRLGQLNLNGSFAYDWARSTNFTGADCFPTETTAQGCLPITGTTVSAQNLNGKQLANAPRYKFNLGGDYRWKFQNDLSLTANAAYVWQSAVNFQTTRDPLAVQPAYGIANAGLTLRDERRRLSWSLFVRNLFDQDYASSVSRNRLWFYVRNTPASSAGTRYEQGSQQRILARDAYRYFGVKVSAAF